MIFREKTLDSETLYSGKILNLRRDKVQAVHGQSYREIVEHRGGSCILPVKDDGNCILIKQFRKAIDDFILEAPAGKRDGDESYYDVAVRELKEETGYTALNMEFMTEYISSPGYSEEKLGIFLATGLKAGERNLDDNEAIDVMEIPLKEAADMVSKGEIADGKTQVAILLAYIRMTEK